VNLIELARVASRWRWVLVPGLVLALVAGFGGYKVTPPEYVQSESWLLLSPVVTEQGRGNPFLQLGNGVPMAASVLVKKVSGGEVAARVAARSPGVTFTVAPDGTTAAPVVVVTAEGPDAEVVGTTLDVLGEQLVSQLAALQRDSGAPEASWVTISRLTGDLAARPSATAGLRTGGIAAVAVATVVLLLVAVLERRRRIRLQQPAAEPVPGEETVADAERALEAFPSRPGSYRPAIATPGSSLLMSRER
jgi:hypothetical protein